MNFMNKEEKRAGSLTNYKHTIRHTGTFEEFYLRKNTSLSHGQNQPKVFDVL